MSDSVWCHRRQLPYSWDSPGKNTGVGCHFLLQCMNVRSESEVTQSCLTLSDPMDCSLPGKDFPGKSTGVGCHCLLRCIPTYIHNALPMAKLLKSFLKCHGHTCLQRATLPLNVSYILQSCCTGYRQFSMIFQDTGSDLSSTVYFLSDLGQSI